MVKKIVISNIYITIEHIIDLIRFYNFYFILELINGKKIKIFFFSCFSRYHM